jgi:hypothetical protein
MKKLLLFAFSVLFVSAVFARPVTIHTILAGPNSLSATDTLELYDNLGNKINNATIKVSGTDPNVDALVGYIWLKNTTNTEMPNVYVRRSMNQEVANTTNSFCFGVNCYPPWVNESAIADTAKVGIINKSFYADYYPDGNGGLTSITFEFFDNITFGVPVSAKATIEFHISATSVKEDKLVFKGPYPNPASQMTSFDYNLPSSANSARLIIRNSLGVEVENSMLDNQSGKKSINVSNYSSGIYFYTLVVDGKTIQSKKIIVKH